MVAARIATFLFFFSLYSIVVCAQPKPANYIAARNLAISYMQTNPDSAKYYLDHYLKLVQGKHDSLIAIGYNNLGVYFVYNLQYDSAIYYLKHAAEKLEGSNAALTRVNLANLYRRVGKFNEAIQTLDIAYKDFRALKDINGIGMVYAEKGSTLVNLQDYNQAIPYYKKAISTFTSLRDTVRATNSRVNLGVLYLNLGNHTFAKDLFEDALPAYKAHQDWHNYATTLSNYGETLIRLDALPQAQQALQEAISYFERFDDLHAKAAVYSRLGTVYIAQQQYERAESAIKYALEISFKLSSHNLVGIGATYLEILRYLQRLPKAVQLIERIEPLLDQGSTNPQDLLNFSKAASQILTESKDYPKAILYLERTITLQDSLNKIQQDKQLQELAASYQNEIQRQKNKNLQQENALLDQNKKLLRNRFWIVTLLALSFFGLWVYNTRSYRQKARIHLLELEQTRLENALRTKELEIERQLSQAQGQVIGQQKQQLAATAVEQANLKEKLHSILHDLKEGKQVNLKSKLNEIEYSPHWNDFIDKFNLINPTFISSLAKAYPALNHSELIFCALVRLNLSFKEIASILHIAHRSVHIKKYRIAKKMALPDDQDFYKVILSIT